MLPPKRGMFLFQIKHCGVVLGYDMLPNIQVVFVLFLRTKSPCGVVLGHDMLEESRVFLF